jgi:hypothetical protein
MHADEGVDNKVFTQNFWYSVCKLVLGQTVSNIKALPGDCLTTWDNFSSRFQVTFSPASMPSGYSHCLTAACQEVATSYSNMTVELFESRLKQYLVHTIMGLSQEVGFTLSRCIFARLTTTVFLLS